MYFLDTSNERDERSRKQKNHPLASPSNLLQEEQAPHTNIGKSSIKSTPSQSITFDCFTNPDAWFARSEPHPWSHVASEDSFAYSPATTAAAAAAASAKEVAAAAAAAAAWESAAWSARGARGSGAGYIRTERDMLVALRLPGGPRWAI